MQPDFIFIIAILIFSVVLHEVSHGYAANFLGDPTARLAGRLTLNPIKHLDMMGSIIIPAILILTGAGFIFGWAKPVPYNPYNLRKGGKYAEAIVAGAGPASNFIIAIIFGLLMRFGIASGIATVPFIQIAGIIVFVNIMLGVFNLIPVYPLDGSKVLAGILPYNSGQAYRRFQDSMARYGLVAMFGFIFIFILILGPIFVRLVSLIFSLITGLPFF
ncbi:site-2 protease family protein [bacterium]|nr:site-2 protease family protein [bacterium]MBT4894750.1 site-2 protease family protein [bacterium]